MKKNKSAQGPIHKKKLIIRTATVRDSNTGYIATFDKKREADDDPHTISFKWEASGKFTQGEAGFSIHTTCLVSKPELGLLQASLPGIFSFVKASGPTTGNIFRDYSGDKSKKYNGDIRSILSIDGVGYAVGYGGAVFRYDISGWMKVDEGLPTSFEIEAMDGFNGDNRIAVGLKGQLWTWYGKKWKQGSSGTKENLMAVCCAGNGRTYVAGRHGILLAGNNGNETDTWKQVNHKIDETIWDLAWFKDFLYISTQTGVFRLISDKKLEPVDFGEDKPSTTYQLSVAPEVMWSVGNGDIMSFDGKDWTRVV